MEGVKQQQVVSEQNKANPSKLYTNFLYKAAIVTVFLVIIPLFPSQAPDFINQTLLTRSWELLHLVFVGIAVSYGLFSRRNDESEKETHHSKFDNAQSYVSRFLQVSSVFDDETEAEAETVTASGSDKLQTWSSQYFRNEPPTVVLAQELSVVDEQRGTKSSRAREKPLLLPVRSLKSRVPDSDSPEIDSRPGRNFGSKRASSGSRNWELKGSDQPELGENLNQNLVLPSPIPWRSRSGRLETKEETAERERRNSPSPSPLYNRASPVEEPELDQSRSARPQMPRSPRPNSAASSPTAVSAESQAKIVEDFMRKKSFRRSPPPPPPPPPPPVLPKSQSFKTSSSTTTRLRSHVDDERDFQRSYSHSSASMDSNSSRSRTDENSRTHVDVQGKSVRTTRAKENEYDNLKQRSVQFDQSCFRNEKPSRESSSFMTKPSFPEKRQYIDKVIEESDEDSEDDDHVEEVEQEETSSDSDDEGPDVDKKADEFIAKFREQIRLQRIESIKKSSGQMNRNSRR